MVTENQANYQNNEWTCHDNEKVEIVQPVQMSIYQNDTSRKNFSLLHFIDKPGAQGEPLKDQRSYLSASVVYIIYANTSQEHQPRHGNSIPSKTVWQIYRDKQQPQKKKLKRWFFFNNRPICFHKNSTSVIRRVKKIKLNFSSIEINNLFPSLVYSSSQGRFKFRRQLQLLPQIRCHNL